MRRVVPKDYRHKGPRERAELKTIGGLTARTDRKKQDKKDKKRKKKAGQYKLLSIIIHHVWKLTFQIMTVIVDKGRGTDMIVCVLDKL